MKGGGEKRCLGDQLPQGRWGGSASSGRKTGSLSDVALLRDLIAQSERICGPVRKEPWTEEEGVRGLGAALQGGRGAREGGREWLSLLRRRTPSAGHRSQGYRGNRGLCPSCT